MLPLQRVIRLDTEEAVRTGTGVRLVLGVLNISESIKTLQLLGPVMLISLKGFVLIAILIEALEHVMIIGRVAMKMKTPIHETSCCFPRRTNNTVPTKRLA
jgi:hypothetical protein